MSKSISNLLQYIGDDNVSFQPLDQSLIGYQARKGHNEYSFGSPVGVDMAKMPLEIHTEKMGIVVWLDRDKVNECMAIKRGAGVAEKHESELLNLKLALQACLDSGAIKAVDANDAHATDLYNDLCREFS